MPAAEDREAIHQPKQSIAGAWRRLSISRQLLIAVNSILVVVASIFLTFDYRVQFAHQLDQKRIALSEEAKTMYESLLSVEQGGPEVIQNLIDNVCARMNTTESPGHHIAVEWRGREYQAKSHGQASADMVAAMHSAAGLESSWDDMANSLVVGLFGTHQGTVYVSEKRSIVIAEARQALAFHVFAVLTIAVLAALIVNGVLRHVISRPIRRMVAALGNVAKGDLTVIAEGKTCKELTYLADHVNLLTRSLKDAERDRQFHMEKARQVQRHLLPQDCDLDGLRVAKIFEPAEDVGGDYYDVVRLSDHSYLLCVADVSGHGVPAAMAAAMIKTLVQDAVEVSQSPAAILQRINRRYTAIILPGHLATMVAVVVDTRQLTITYANAGHEPPLLQFPSGEIKRLTTGDLLLGVDDATTYDEECLSVPKGTRLILVSDGVTEMFDPDGNQFGTERIEAVLQEAQGRPVQDVVETFKDSLRRFGDTRPPFDDTTLLIAEFLGTH